MSTDQVNAVAATKPAPLRILVADDDPATRTLIGIALKRRDLACTYASNGAMAIALARKLLPDILILDVMMPDLDGYGVLMLLKSDRRTRHIKIILLTSCDRESDVARGLASGADDYVTKPFIVVDLAKHVMQLSPQAIARATRVARI